MVAATRRCYTAAAPTGGRRAGGASWYPTRPIRAPRLRASPASRSPEPDSHHESEVPNTRWPPPARRWPPTNRDVTGKAVDRLRQDGRLPAVVYGHGVDSSNVSVDAHEFEQLRRHVGPNALIDLSVDGKKAQPVLVQHVQVHPVNRRPLHVDLFLVRMTEELTVDVPLVATGESPAVANARRHAAAPERDGPRPRPAGPPAAVDRVLGRVARRLRRARSTSATSTIPGDVTLLTDPDEIIAKVQAPRVEVEEAGRRRAEGEEAAEGAEGAAEGETAGDEAGASTEG